jgi:hypothetical protein
LLELNLADIHSLSNSPKDAWPGEWRTLKSFSINATGRWIDMWKIKKAVFPKVATCKEKTASNELNNDNNPKFFENQLDKARCGRCIALHWLKYALMCLATPYIFSFFVWRVTI